MDLQTSRKFNSFFSPVKQTLSRVDWVILVIAILVGCMLGALSILRYTGYNSFMLDIGNMSQAIWSGTQGHPLEFTYEGANVSRLSLHVELFYWLLTPLYSLFPSPISLLVFQAILFIAGAYPVYRLANRRLQSKTAARLITLTYLFFPVAQTAVLFDFHGDTLAMPLLMFALESMDRKAWPSYYFWTVLSLSCKFYIALPVAIVGVILWLRGQKRVGITTIALATAWGLVANFIIRPMFSPAGNTGPEFVTLWGYFQFYFGNVFQDLSITLVVRLATLLIVILPAILLARHAYLWLLPAATIILPAVITPSNRGLGYFNHHYATAVPFLIIAIIYGADKLQKQQEQHRLTQHTGLLNNWLAAVSATFIFALAVNIFLVDTPLNPLFWNQSLTGGLNPSQYGQIGRDRFKDQWIDDHIPADSPVAASLHLMAHLTNRQYLFPINQISSVIQKTEYAISDALVDCDEILNKERVSIVNYDSKIISILLSSPEFGLVNSEDGLLLFKKNPVPADVLSQMVMVSTNEKLPDLIANFSNLIGLSDFKITPLGERRFRLQFDWVSLQPLEDIPTLFAVSRLEGVDNARIVHLPTKVLLPTDTWKEGEIISEEFEVEFRQDIPSGSYPIWVGWYDSSNPNAFFTDRRSRVGEEYSLGSILLR
jgi:uncharacterized membrane protein